MVVHTSFTGFAYATLRKSPTKYSMEIITKKGKIQEEHGKIQPTIKNFPPLFSPFVPIFWPLVYQLSLLSRTEFSLPHLLF